MFNKEQYQKLRDEAFDDLHKIKKIKNYDDSPWESLYGKCRTSLLKLYAYIDGHRTFFSSAEIFPNLYYLAWVEYNNYVCTGELADLSNAEQHYSLIRKMPAFSGSIKKNTLQETDQVTKYMSRFIWVSILLHRKDLTADLLEEMKTFISINKHLVSERSFTYYMEHIDKVKKFCQSINNFTVESSNGDYFHVDNRLVSTGSHRSSGPRGEMGDRLQLTEVVIFTTIERQVQFESRNPDMFRISNLFEYTEKCGYRNPIKRVFCDPRICEFIAVVFRSMRRLRSSEALVLYISSDLCSGAADLPVCPANTVVELGGPDKFHVESVNVDWMYPFTRCPLLLIIDSRNSNIFMNLSSISDKPLICFFSPQKTLDSVNYDATNGNLFTLFLSCPLAALCLICDVTHMKQKYWICILDLLKQFGKLCVKMIEQTHEFVDYLPFLYDPFMHRVILNYCFCTIVLRHHRNFRHLTCVPLSNPPIDEVVCADAVLKQKVMDIYERIEISQSSKSSKQFFDWDSFV